MSNYPNKNCLICGKSFKPRCFTGIICPSYKCKHTRFQQKKREWERENYNFTQYGTFDCPYCKTSVPQSRLDQKTCFKKECINTRRNKIKRLKRLAA